MDHVVIGENNKTEKSWIFFKKAVDKFPLHCYNNEAVRNDGKTCGGVAHLGERLHGMQEVRGSIPLISTKLKNPNLFLMGMGFGFFVYLNETV